MKNFYQLTFILCLIILMDSQSAWAQKSIEVDSNIVLIDGHFAPYNSVGAGDTILLKPGRKQLLILRNLVGSENQPLVVTNGDGLVEINSTHYFGISIRQCNHLKLSGAGKQGLKYGIQILNIQGSGLSIGDYSTNIEAEKIEIGNILYSGIIAKTEPDCNFDRNSFIQENTIIHDCHIFNTGTEGMYIGSSFYSGQTLICDSMPKIVLPALLRNVKIYNNIVEHTGWDGIQVSSATNASIYNNKVSYDSQEKADWQMTGITLGGGSTGSIYANTIINGEGTGIFTNGLGEISIYNNIIQNPGFSNNQSSGQYGIYATDAFAYPGMYFYIFNNLILHSKKTGIHLINSLSSDKNIIQNNAISSLGTSASNSGSNPFIEVDGNKVILKNNYYSSNDDNMQIAKKCDGEFELNASSPLIDAGNSEMSNHITTDIYGKPRVNGYRIDIGPIESEYSRYIEYMQSEPIKDIVYPNPVKQNELVNIIINNEWPGNVKINLIDNAGKIIKTIADNYYIEGNISLSIDSRQLHLGLNFLQIERIKNSNILRIVVNEP